MSSTYIRFVINQHDEDSQKPQGLFQAVDILRYEGSLSPEELKIADQVFHWFNKNLPVPKRFSRSRKRSAQAKAISWFKSNAHDFINQMQDLAGILYAHDVPVKIIKTKRPGYIVYEDEFQVVAEPFSQRR